MKGYTVFYSWQSDTPDECNRAFIRSALKSAIKSAAIELDDFVEPERLGDGMREVAGSPEVAAMMFRQIDKCSVFVGDFTLVGKVEPQKPGGEHKRTANPNVMIEMGYAAARIGWERVICVMNTFYGSQSDLPFDSKNRRYPIDFRLNPNDPSSADRVLKELTLDLKRALASVTKASHESACDVAQRLNKRCLDFMRYMSERKVEAFGDPELHYDLYHDLRSRRITVQGERYAREDLDSGELARVVAFEHAIDRLIDLGLLWCEHEPEHKLHYYVWTYLGRQVLDLLGLGWQYGAPRD